MSKPPQPNWQPSTHLPQITFAIDGMLAAAEEQALLLQQAQPKPHVLDDAVGRVIRVSTTQRDDLWWYAEQLRRWTAQQLTDPQRREVERLTEQLERLRQAITAILVLADELKRGTIERVLAESDLEVGLEFLLRGNPDQKC